MIDFLAANPDLPKRSVCVPGCGTGHDVRVWAQAGFDAVGYDIAPSAVERGNEATKAAGLVADFHLGNFLSDRAERQFDWIFEHTFYCAIDPDRRDDYVDAIVRWLKPGGQFLAVHYLIPDEVVTFE